MASRLAAKQSDTGFKNEATIGAERAMSFCLSFIQARFPVSCQSNAISIATVSILTALLAPAVEATYDFFSRRLDSVPRPNTEGIRHILKEMDAAHRSPDDFVDVSLLDEIEQEGFAKKFH
jgi:hypothetical protein